MNVALEEFRAAAAQQEGCAVCGSRGPFQPHHVVYEAHLRRNGHGSYRFDPRDVLRVCHKDHRRHHDRIRVIRTVELLDFNVQFAFDRLGPAAFDYLRRYYDDSQEDPRLRRLLNGRARIDGADEIPELRKDDHDYYRAPADIAGTSVDDARSAVVNVLRAIDEGRLPLDEAQVPRLRCLAKRTGVNPEPVLERARRAA